MVSISNKINVANLINAQLSMYHYSICERYNKKVNKLV